MNRVRGLIALFISICLGLFVATAVWVYLKQPRHKAYEERVSKPTDSPRPVSFAEGIPGGMRVISIRVDAVEGVSRNLKKGDFVDVMVVHALPDKGQGNLARVILQNIEIYALSLSSGDEAKSSRRKEKSWTVSLLLTPQQASILAAATANGDVRLSARNQTDPDDLSGNTTVYLKDYGIVDIVPEREDIQQLIAPGMRAISLEVRDTDGILGSLRQGDRVDVMLCVKASQFAAAKDIGVGAIAEVTSKKKVSRILLQDMEVLATEKTYRLEVDSYKPVKRVLLHVTPRQAETLAVVSDTAKSTFLRLLTRNNKDRGRVKTEGRELQELISQKREIHQIPIFRREEKSKVVFYK